MTGTPQHETPQHQDPPTDASTQPTPASSPRTGRRSGPQLTLLVAGALVLGLGLGAVGGAGARAARPSGGGSTPMADGAPLEVGTGAPADAKMSALWAGWLDRRTFTGSGLSQEAGRAHVWAFDTAAALDPTAVTRAARAFGLTGEPTAQWGSWLVGPTDGSGPSLSVSGDGQATFTYSDPTTWCIPSGGDATVLPAAPPTAEGSVVGSAPDGSAPDEFASSAPQGAEGSSAPSEPYSGKACPTATLSSEDAISRARDLLTAAGVQLGDARFSATGSDGLSSVMAEQVLGGSTTGVTWSVAFVGQTLQQVWGPLASTVDLGEYTLVSPADAVARLADPRFAGTGLVMPLDLTTRAVSPAVPGVSKGLDAPTLGVGPVPPSVSKGLDAPTASEGPEVPDPAQSTVPTAVPLPSAGAPLSWGVRPVVLVSAELTLVATPLGDGAMVLLPSYLLTDADGWSWQVPAVSDAGLGLA